MVVVGGISGAGVWATRETESVLPDCKDPFKTRDHDVALELDRS
jgi:hypothetical protein